MCRRRGCSNWTARRRRLRRSPAAPPPLPCGRKTSPTSSTPPAPPEPQKAWRWSLAAAQIDSFAMTPQARVLQFASPSFDAAVSEIVTAFGSGATLVLPAQERRGDGLGQLLREQTVTHATLPPVLLNELSEEVPLQTLIVAGEACSAEAAGRWAQGRRMIKSHWPTRTPCC